MGYTVMLIDDVETTRTLMRLLLSETGYRVVGEAGTLLSGLQKFASLRADIVILDLEMPDGNGMEAAPRLRDISPDVVIVVASAHNDVESVQGALQCGAHGFLIKPFTPGALERALVGAVRRAGRHVPAAPPAQ